jgi:DNA-binding CsgD family transcriptional regulator
MMQELDDYRERLETLVMKRTRALSETNRKLHTEIAIRTHTAKQLHLKTERLKELNTAMGVLLDKRDEDRLLIEENIRVNLKQLVEPYIERMASSGLNPTQRQLLEVIRMNINEVIGSPLANVSAKYYIFSPGELQVANLIRNGKTTKDIARLLRLSSRTVESYRNSIRKKLGLKNRRVNLRTYLSSQD